jgi:hypothetical protein
MNFRRRKGAPIERGKLLEGKWCARRDSNAGPLAPEAVSRRRRLSAPGVRTRQLKDFRLGLSRQLWDASAGVVGNFSVTPAAKARH